MEGISGGTGAGKTDFCDSAGYGTDPGYGNIQGSIFYIAKRNLKWKTQPDFLPDAQESGTPNVPGLAGLAAGIRFVRSVGPENILAHERRLAQETARALEGIGLLEVFSNPAQTGVLSVRFRDIPAESAAEQLARQGIAVRAGLHCAPLAHRTAGTEQTGTVRLSFGFYSTAGQAEQAAKAFKLVKKL